MGTNFYWATFQSYYTNGTSRLYTGRLVSSNAPDASRALHIGKRSAAGRYCWDCMATLAEGGEALVHHTGAGWHEACRYCGAAPEETGGDFNHAAAVELGFKAPRKLKPQGVVSAASFTWAQDPVAVLMTCQHYPHLGLVKSEYGDVLTGIAFVKMLEYNCPIQFYNAIGQDFS